MKIALIGNQNSGKTTLFNTLTGMNSKIGNWPGVTIEKKIGIIKNTNFEVTDLPGIYSLSPYSLEEDVSRKFLFEEKPDVIINIIDSTSLERSLYLTTQLLELDTKIIIALNMTDILEKKGILIDVKKLEEKIGVKVVKISALKKTGVTDLVSALRIYNEKKKIKKYDSIIENSISKIKSCLGELPHKDFVSVKLLEEDSRFKKYEDARIKNIIAQTKEKYSFDMEEVIATQRYEYIGKVKELTLKQSPKKHDFSDTLDKIFLNRVIAFPIFILIMFLVYYLSVGVVGSYTGDIVKNFFVNISYSFENFLNNIGVSKWIISLIVNGIFEGLGTVFGFVPQLIALFFCISILETTGYMSRIALLLDRVFRKLGMSGKSLIPFIVGLGCSVPGIMSSRIIENQNERKMTAVLTPFIPCSAKLPAISLFASYFWKDNVGLISASLYFLSIAIIIISALTMKKFIFKNASVSYILELPKYKLPSIKYIFQDVLDKIISFIKKAGSVILICNIVIWFLLSFSTTLEYGIDIEDSILASVGKKISWIFYPMLGVDSWEATVSSIQGLVAKEQVVSSMAIINGLSDKSNSSVIFPFFTPISAYAFIVFNLFSAPCLGALAAMKKELGSFKKVLVVMMFEIGLAWLLAVSIFQVGYRLENGLLSAIDIFTIGLLCITTLSIILRRSSKSNCKNKSCCNGCKMGKC